MLTAQRMLLLIALPKPSSSKPSALATPRLSCPRLHLRRCRHSVLPQDDDLHGGKDGGFERRRPPLVTAVAFFPVIHGADVVSFKDMRDTLLNFPSLLPFLLSDVVALLLDRESTDYKIFLEYSHDVLNSDGIIVNTFESLVVKSWAPQVAVLEAVRKLNRAVLVEEVALRIEMVEDGFVAAEEVERQLRELMGEADEVRRMVEQSLEAAAAMEEGGSSIVEHGKPGDVSEGEPEGASGERQLTKPAEEGGSSGAKGALGAGLWGR
ncbi:UDP-glycosyltransferase 88B1 [Striga asiatica]|uniref:UDP-glycosyltransferase 88B1 n=1 Tax=Striga asiatica TaxID=4170 RepID=A0A5A7PK09_STRAF|nr:UDP-glycosyltransferase 88B1 [Striga asiatica]